VMAPRGVKRCYGQALGPARNLTLGDVRDTDLARRGPFTVPLQGGSALERPSRWLRDPDQGGRAGERPCTRPRP